MGSASLVGLLAAMAAAPAAAQDVAAEDEPAQHAAEEEGEPEILVTATRVERSGFSAPTPTVVIGEQDFQQSGATDVGALLAESPSFRASEAPNNQGNSGSRIGGNFVSLRGLFPTRTLVLVNGRRHVSTNVSGWVDVNAIPTVLLDRVEVVTGGASAAWGSDAVAGVVNFILDRDFEGVKLEGQYGLTHYGDNQEYRVAAAFGTSFLGGRGHITLAAEASESEGILDQTDRPWSAREWQIIPNPAFTPTNGRPQRLLASNVHHAQATLGGLIVSGPLAGTQFLPGGGTAPFTFGSIRSGPFMVGGDGLNMGRYTSLSVPFDRQAVFGQAQLELGSNITLWVEGSYARTHAENNVVMPFNFGDLTIRIDNAFLPAAVRQRMVDAGITQFMMGRLSVDMGFYRADNTSRTKRGAIGLEGEFGGGWAWDANYQYGRTDFDQLLRSRINERYPLAVDSVINPATGQPACRVNADSNPANDVPGCVPINLFGFGAPQQAAIDWVMGIGRQDLRVTQQTAAINLRGEPFATWAGPVSVAFGAEYRRESVLGTVDARSQANGFAIGNFQPIAGRYNVKEAYGEVVVPLLRQSSLGHALDLNAAFRLTDYSTSGTVNTWKIGATWSVIEDLRLRATRSRDIRAPNAFELFTGNTLGFGSVNYRGTPVFISRVVGGNINLEPERADTLTLGVVYSPGWLRGLRMSVDYFDIDIDGAIGVLQPQDTLNRCEAGNARFCDLILRDAAGVPTRVLQPQLNLGRLIVRGVDMELRYDTPLDRIFPGGRGDLGVHILATHIADFISDDGVVRVDRAGDFSTEVQNIASWRGTASLTYTLDPFSFYLQGRYVGSGLIDHTFGANGIDDNRVRAALFLDATIRYMASMGGNSRAELFFAVRNLLNSDPPIVPQSFVTPLATNAAYYDVAGRTYTVGARFRF